MLFKFSFFLGSRLFPEYYSAMTSPGLSHRQGAPQMALKKRGKESLVYSWGGFPNFKTASLEKYTYIFLRKPPNYHLKLKILNIFSGISYHTENSTNLLSLSECFEARKRSGDSSKTILLWNLIYVEKYKWWRYNVYLCVEGTHFSQLSYPILLFKKIHIWLFFFF